MLLYCIFGHVNYLKLNVLNYKVLDLFKLYNFDIKFNFVNPMLHDNVMFFYQNSLSP